ncbi:hypothetical protein EJ07DRAFT_183835 [Lizonia empirigonia]|nr:hypothetical protein EJ07DRAFT_183835 [Lizonia empirigonia]
MALQAVRQCMIDRKADRLLKLLPANETVQWRIYSLKEPQAALVIGCFGDYELLACKEPSSAERFVLQYCSQKRSEVVRSWLTTELPASAVEQDMVVDLPLSSPFKYSANSNSTLDEQSDLSVLIQWYFLSHEHDDIVYDIDEYCTRFHKALRDMEPQLISAGLLNSWGPSTRSFDAAEAPGSPEARCSPTQGWFTPLKGASPGGNGDSDYERLVEFLGNDASPGLLKDLPKPNITHFVEEETPFQNALSQKLPIGECKDTKHRIYAYMRGWGGHYRVELYIEEGEQRAQLKTTDVAKHTIYHPFDKTYPQYCQIIDKDGKVRLSLLIKWYFVVAGVADAGVLKEMNNYPERLRSMLRWVQGRMHPAAHVENYEGKLYGCVASDEDSTKALSSVEAPCTPSWEATSHTSSGLNEIEQLARSIDDRVTEHVAGERSRDHQDKNRLDEIDQQLGQLRTERSRIERSRKRRFSQLKEASSAVDIWMQQI